MSSENFMQINPDGKTPYFLDTLLITNLNKVKHLVYQDWDMVYVVAGIEGGGKSTVCFQLAKFLDPSFNIDRICFTPDQFKTLIKGKSLVAGNCIVLDEGFLLNSRSSMTKMNIDVMNILSQCRQKNLYLFICCPNFFDLDRNISLWRSRGLFYIEHRHMKRGYGKFFNYEKKKRLFIKGKRFYNYNVVDPSFYFCFKESLVVDSTEYRRRKLDAFENSSNIINSQVTSKEYDYAVGKFPVETFKNIETKYKKEYDYN